MTHEKSPSRETAEEQRALVMAMFLDSAGDDNGERVLALIDHCGIDLAACNGDVKQVPNVIAAHYRVGRGYDIDRAAHDLLTYPPVAARIEELEAQKRRAGKR